MCSRASNVEAMNRQLDIGSQGAELHAVIKARQWAGAASLINGAPCAALFSDLPSFLCSTSARLRRATHGARPPPTAAKP